MVFFTSQKDPWPGNLDFNSHVGSNVIFKTILK